MYKIEKNSAQEIADAIQSLLLLDVTIVDKTLKRIAATGNYRHLVGEYLPKGCSYEYTINSKKTEIITETALSSRCAHCKSASICKEIATVGYPIISRDGQALGAIGLIAFKESQWMYIKENQSTITRFLGKLGELLAGNLAYEETIKNLFLRNQEITTIVNSLDYGLCLADTNQRITIVNKQLTKLLNHSEQDLIGKRVDEIFTTPPPIADSPGDGTMTVKSRLADPRIRFSIKMIITPIHEDIRNYVLQVSRYSNELMNAYNIIERKDEINFSDICGDSAALQNIITLAKQISTGDSSVLIRGESGTGKELFARSIHYASNRRHKPFVAINCASIPDTLLESELFGYERGAFSGANTSGKVGRFELANGGTLFLDEIGDMPLHLQPKLLRVLQDGSFLRLGGKNTIKVNFRLITATNRNLENMIKNKEFREDLYFRLNVIPINIPPLRERKDDIPLLVNIKLAEYCQKLNKPQKKISNELMEVFCNAHWKGNVRELENVIEYLVNISEKNLITPKYLPDYFKSIDMNQQSHRIPDSAEILSHMDGKSLNNLTECFEKEILISYLKQYGTTTKAKKEIANQLKINLSTLYRKLYRYHIDDMKR